MIGSRTWVQIIVFMIQVTFIPTEIVPSKTNHLKSKRLGKTPIYHSRYTIEACRADDIWVDCVALSVFTAAINEAEIGFHCGQCIARHQRLVMVSYNPCFKDMQHRFKFTLCVCWLKRSYLHQSLFRGTSIYIHIQLQRNPKVIWNWFIIDLRMD